MFTRFNPAKNFNCEECCLCPERVLQRRQARRLSREPRDPLPGVVDGASTVEGTRDQVNFYTAATHSEQDLIDHNKPLGEPAEHARPRARDEAHGVGGVEEVDAPVYHLIG